MDNKTYKVQETLKWFKQFDNELIKINSKNKEFEIKIDERALPHLLGLHYMKLKNENAPIKGKRLINFIEINNLSDQNILTYVNFYNDNKTNDVVNRINTFKDFFENLENGVIYEQINPFTNIKSSFLIVQTRDNMFLHLGIKQDEFGDTISEFNVDTKTRDILETYFAREDDKYFKNSKFFEPIVSIERFNELDNKYETFSFNDKTREKLEEEHENISWGIKNNVDFER